MFFNNYGFHVAPTNLVKGRDLVRVGIDSGRALVLDSKLLGKLLKVWNPIVYCPILLNSYFTFCMYWISLTVSLFLLQKLVFCKLLLFMIIFKQKNNYSFIDEKRQGHLILQNERERERERVHPILARE